MRIATLAAGIVLVLACAATTTSFAAGSCDTPEHHQFDFWLGTWKVSTPDGKEAGKNRIEREYDGCVLHEHYTTPRGYTGESLNVYDASRKLWHQTWVDNEGTLLLLEGRLRDGKMVLEGQTVGADQIIVKHRITWNTTAEGVRQLWESTDAKGDWRTVFDGRYSRIKAATP
jgi:hypothetical protein